MQTITLMRHAKSSWADSGLSDHDRPLNKRGNNDAPEMARRLLKRDDIPNVILCSSAQRTRETTAHLLDVFDASAPEVQYHEALYLASPRTMLDMLHSAAAHAHIMIIAHNPGIEDLSARLQGIADDIMPTAAIRQFTCPSVASLCTHFLNRNPKATATDDIDIKLIYTDYPKNLA